MTSNPELYERVNSVRDDVKTLLLLIKDRRSSVTLDEANSLTSVIRETEGWLQSCRKFLTTEGLDEQT